MTEYKVEIKLEDTKVWDDVLKLKPDYVFTIEWKRRAKWWFKRREVAYCENLREAEMMAAMKAVTYAKAMYAATPCRVVKTSTENGIKFSDIIWQNGHPKHLQPWTTRVWDGLLSLLMGRNGTSKTS
jgi:hypothetical protein